jgi:hypothetical protein
MFGLGRVFKPFDPPQPPLKRQGGFIVVREIWGGGGGGGDGGDGGEIYTRYRRLRNFL